MFADGNPPDRDRPLWLRLLIGRSLKRTLIRAGITAVVLGFTSQVVLVPVRIEGISMEPTYRDHGINFVNRLAFWLHPPQRGDIVALRVGRWDVLTVLSDLLAGHRATRAAYLKRIVGLPGETVDIRQGVVWINGQPLDEPYVKAREAWQLAPVKLADDEYFVIGDNRGMDQQDHKFGVTKGKRIVGKVLW